MKIGIVAPSPVPFCIGGAEKLCWGLLDYINQQTPHKAELIKLPSREHSFWELIDTYREFTRLDLSHFDVVVSTKYPSWMVRHPNQVCYMLHRLRGLYDTYHFTGLPLECDSAHPKVRALIDFMKRYQGDPTRLDEFFAGADRLRGADIPPEVLIFPGPLIRQVVRFLDDAGLAPSRIRRYAAISRNVVGREGYFPRGAGATAVYPPSDLPYFIHGKQQYFFTVGRLDGAKRIHLLVSAMLRARTDVTLKIAGTGPDEEALRRLAGGDSRIQFLGFAPDREVIQLYGDSLAVPYVPYDEDYGLVTIEAMASGKPVLTTTDAGGPNEFVRNGETGFVVAPDPEALAERLDFMASHRQALLEMKPACQDTVKPITWAAVCRALLGSTDTPRSRRAPASQRPKLTLATTFPIYPPRGGGQSRVFHLYRNLASEFDVDIISFSDFDQPPFDELIAPNMREIRIPKSREHAQAEWRLVGKMHGAAAADVVMPKLYRLTPRYVEALKHSAAGSGVLVASHPYLLPALEGVRRGQALIYEAQDVESTLKETILPANRLGRYFLRLTRSVEERCCNTSSLVLTCSEEDSRALSRIYAVPREKLLLAPNGVDLDSVTYRPLDLRRHMKRQYRGEAPFTALFVASWHGPNIEAALCVLHIALQMQHIRFLLMGSAALYLKHFHFALPPNLESLGVVDDRTKDEILSWVDLGINPMESGSGSNLKMLDYMGAGVPVLSTKFGARGLDIENGIHARIAALTDFPRAIEEMRNQDETVTATMVEAARSHAATRFSWDVIARKFAAALRNPRRPGEQAVPDAARGSGRA
jgi:glycosyltransferase involved in cell wall biosynthesis